MPSELARIESVNAIPELNLKGWKITDADVEYPLDSEDRIKLCADLRPISPDAVDAAKAAPSLIEGWVGSGFGLRDKWWLITYAAERPDANHGDQCWSLFASVEAVCIEISRTGSPLIAPSEGD